MDERRATSPPPHRSLRGGSGSRHRTTGMEWGATSDNRHSVRTRGTLCFGAGDPPVCLPAIRVTMRVGGSDGEENEPDGVGAGGGAGDGGAGWKCIPGEKTASRG